jgi:hypothetical protein
MPHPADMKRSNTNQYKQVEPEYVGVDGAEQMTGVSRWTWRRWAYDGHIASVKLSRRLLIPVAEIRRVLAEGYRPANDNPSPRACSTVANTDPR